MVMTAVDDSEASTRIWKLCKEKRIAANIADVPPECDFYFGSVHRDGPLQIMVSTNGNGPKMANIVRRRIAATLPPNIGEAIAKVGALRKKLRVLAPGDEQGPKRMKWYVRRKKLANASHANIAQDVEGLRTVELRRSMRYGRSRYERAFARLCAGPGTQLVAGTVGRRAGCVAI